MSGWGIAETAPKIEKIKAESADYLNGLNSCGEIPWEVYNYAFDFYAELIQKAYELGKSEVEPHWISVTEDTPDEERECWITPKTTSKVYRGIFTRHYGECHRTGFICDEGFMWLNTALAWMYCEVPEPYKGVTE